MPKDSSLIQFYQDSAGKVGDLEGLFFLPGTLKSSSVVILHKLSALRLIDKQFSGRHVSFIPRFCSDFH